LAGCQALEFLRPLQTSPLLEKIHAKIRTVVKAWDADRVMAPDVEKVAELIREGAITKVVRENLPTEALQELF
jgi:histidine ammonia-lyase